MKEGREKRRESKVERKRVSERQKKAEAKKSKKLRKNIGSQWHGEKRITSKDAEKNLVHADK